MPAGEPVRVVRMITRLNIGGPARQALLLTRGLATPWPTALIAGTPADDEGELSDPDVPVARLPLVRPLRPVADARALVAARRLLAEHHPAILHTHMAKAGTVGRSAAASLARSSRPRTVHTFHGHVLDGYFSPLVSRAFVAIERRLARRTTALVAVSPEIRDALLDLGIGRASQYRVIPLGLELDDFLAVDGPTGVLRRQLGLDATVPLVGAVGRAVRIKALDQAIDAVERLPSVHLAIIGDGDERPALEAEVRRRSLGDRVHFTGWSASVVDAVSDLDVVLLTSRNEGTPVALIEALAAARPVVATDVGGVRSVVDHERTGLLAPFGDVTLLAAHLERLLADRPAAARLGVAGRAHVAARFGSTRLLHDIDALYSELVG
jgi:glycosyltransferase involved in cell wall biosynthesis